MFCRNSFILFFLVFSFYTQAQQRVIKEDRHSIDPFITYFRGTNTTQVVNQSGDEYVSSWRSGKVYDFIRVGLNYSYAIKDKLYVLSGVGFSNPQHSERIVSNVNTSTRDYIRRMIEVPLGIRWVYSQNRCKSYLQAEYIHQFYLHSILHESGRSAIEKESINPIQKRLNFGIGAEFRPWINVGLYAQLNANVKVKDKEAGELNNNLGLGISVGSRIYL